MTILSLHDEIETLNEKLSNQEQLLNFQTEMIDYMLQVVNDYVSIYTKIGDALKEVENEEEFDGLQDEIESCFEAIQPLLSMHVDLRPANVVKTLTDYKFSKLKHKGNSTLN